MWLSFKSPIKNMKIGSFTLRLEHIKLWLFSRSCPILHFACEILPQLITNWPVTTYQAFLFYRAGVYWIYILWIHPSCLKSNFQCTPALEKRMTIHCLNWKIRPHWQFAPLGPWDCLRGRIFQYTPPLGSVLLQFFSRIGKSVHKWKDRASQIFWLFADLADWGNLNIGNV